MSADHPQVQIAQPSGSIGNEGVVGHASLGRAAGGFWPFKKQSNIVTALGPGGESNYVPGFDGLRAVAVILVMIQHLSYKILPGGGIGVDAFFVLSGYLITTILVREKSRTGVIRLGAFYSRRVLRLAPALTVMVIAVTAVASTALQPGDNTTLDAVFTLTYLMDFVRTFSHQADPSPLGHTWSLAVEEQFYLIWPILLAALLALNVKARLWLAVAGVLLLQAWNVLLVAALGATYQRMSFSFDTRAVELMTGCALAIWIDSGFFPRVLAAVSRLGPAAMIILGVTALADRSLGNPSGGARYLLTALCVAAVLVSILRAPGGVCSRFLSLPPLIWLGRISYGVYLWHYPLLLFARLLADHNQILAGGAIILSVPVAALSYRYIEAPFLAMKAQMQRKEAEPAVAARPSAV